MNFAKVFLLTALLSAAACSGRESQPAAFRPQQVACYDQSSTALREQFNHIRNVGRDAYVIDNFNTALPVFKKLADSGNVEGMSAYGHFLFLKLFSDNADKKTGQFDTRNLVLGRNATDALAYIYLSSMHKWERQAEDTHFIKEIESGRFKGILSEQWINEAKANAAVWKAHCGK